MAKWTEPGDMLDVWGVEQPVDHVKHEERLHPVIRKALPGFGEGDVSETARVADETTVVRVVLRHGMEDRQ